MVIKIGGMDQLIDLLFQRFIIVLVMITQCKHSDTGAKIQIFFSFHVCKINAISFFQDHREAVVEHGTVKHLHQLKAF